MDPKPIMVVPEVARAATSGGTQVTVIQIMNYELSANINSGVN